MPFAANEIIDVTIKGSWAGQAWYNTWQYRINPTVGTVTAPQLGQAWWNHVKATYRALALDNQGNIFLSVITKSLSVPLGEYGEFAVPITEQLGTRVPPTNNQPLPTANAVGVRLSVGSRVTRPGQKRFTFLTEEDVISNAVSTGFRVIVQNLMNVVSVGIVLGAPAATMGLTPSVVSLGPTGLPIANQAIAGFIINSNVTTQTSRRAGRGI